MSSPDLRGRHFLKEIDYSPEEWSGLLELTGRVKRDKAAGRSSRRLRGKNLALIFEKASTRTRCAFEVAAFDEGAQVTYLDPASSHLGHKESVADTARVLGRMYDGIEYRGFDQDTVEGLARYAGVPVWNGLSDQWHPTQSLCDTFTMIESAGRAPESITFAYVGDARNNVAHSLLVAGAMLGMDVRMVAPESLLSAAAVQDSAQAIAGTTGARLTLTDDVAAGVEGVDFVYTDVWVSMGEAPSTWTERLRLLAPYRVSSELMKATGNPEAKFMHCLPALHNAETGVGRQLQERTRLCGVEVADDVFESEQSIVFDQAENRMHSIRAILVATLGD